MQRLAQLLPRLPLRLIVIPGGGAGLTAHFDYIRPGGFVPHLQFENLDGTLRILWPPAATGFTLQSAPAVTGTWAAAGDPIAVGGGMNVVTVPRTTGTRFHRLVQ